MQPHKHAEVTRVLADGVSVPFLMSPSGDCIVQVPCVTGEVRLELVSYFDEQTDDSTGIVEVSE